MSDRGVSFTDTLLVLHTLGYAEDLGLLDYVDGEDVSRSSSQVSKITEGSRKDVDMKVKITKTKVIHVRRKTGWKNDGCRIKEGL